MFKKALKANAPVLIDCLIDMDDKVFPMVPGGAPISDAFDESDLKGKNRRHSSFRQSFHIRVQDMQST